jgi:hypothetical protein
MAEPHHTDTLASADEPTHTRPEARRVSDREQSTCTTTFTRIGILAAHVVARIPVPTTVPAIPRNDLRPRWEQIVRLCSERCGGTAQGIRWLETPKLAFTWRRPVDLLGTEEGCDRVTDLLNELWK